MSRIQRLVEVKGSSDGTGFLISDRLILTAWHVIRPRDSEPIPSTIKVRIEKDVTTARTPADADREAALLWPIEAPSSNHDFALLILPKKGECGAYDPNDKKVEPNPWAELTSWGEVQVTAVGYPDIAIDHQRGQRDTKGITGWVQTADNFRQRSGNVGTLTIRMKAEDAPAKPPAEAWPAMSGAPVFAGSALVGLVQIAGSENHQHQLRMLPVARLFSRPDIGKAITDSGCALPLQVELETKMGAAGEAERASIVGAVDADASVITGRGANVESVSKSVIKNSVVLVKGMPGVGKTTLLQELVHKANIIEEFGHRIVQFSFEEITSWPQFESELAGSIMFPTFVQAGVRRLIRAEDKNRGLLVFDNFETVSREGDQGFDADLVRFVEHGVGEGYTFLIATRLGVIPVFPRISVRQHTLPRLEDEAARALFQSVDSADSIASDNLSFWTSVTQGNPLTITLVATLHNWFVRKGSAEEAWRAADEEVQNACIASGRDDPLPRALIVYGFFLKRSPRYTSSWTLVLYLLSLLPVGMARDDKVLGEDSLSRLCGLSNQEFRAVLSNLAVRGLVEVPRSRFAYTRWYLLPPVRDVVDLIRDPVDQIGNILDVYRGYILKLELEHRKNPNHLGFERIRLECRNLNALYKRFLDERGTSGIASVVESFLEAAVLLRRYSWNIISILEYATRSVPQGSGLFYVLQILRGVSQIETIESIAGEEFAQSGIQGLEALMSTRPLKSVERYFLALGYFNLGVMGYHNDDLQGPPSYYEKALKQVTDVKYPGALALQANCIFFATVRDADLRSYIPQYQDKPVSTFSRWAGLQLALELFRGAHEPFGEGNVEKALADVLETEATNADGTFDQECLARAESRTYSALSLFERFGRPANIGNCWRALYQIEMKRGNPAGATRVWDLLKNSMESYQRGGNIHGVASTYLERIKFRKALGMPIKTVESFNELMDAVSIYRKLNVQGQLFRTVYAAMCVAPDSSMAAAAWRELRDTDGGPPFPEHLNFGMELMSSADFQPLDYNWHWNRERSLAANKQWEDIIRKLKSPVT